MFDSARGEDPRSQHYRLQMAVGGSAVAEPTDPRRTPAPAALFGSSEACTRDIIQYSYWFSFLAGIVSRQIDAWKFTSEHVNFALCFCVFCCVCAARLLKTDRKEGPGGSV